jgi:hypothetical protein
VPIKEAEKAAGLIGSELMESIGLDEISMARIIVNISNLP